MMLGKCLPNPSGSSRQCIGSWLLCLWLLICLGTLQPVQAQETISIEVALTDGLVAVRIEGMSYYFDRPIVNLYATNQSDTKLKIKVPRGLLLRGDAPSLSGLIVVRDNVQTLQRDETDRLFELYVYSSDITRNFSSPTAHYQIVGMTDNEDWLRILDQASIYDNPLPGQVALWQYISGLDMEAIKARMKLQLAPEQQEQVNRVLQAVGRSTPTLGVTPKATATPSPLATSSPKVALSPTTAAASPLVTPTPDMTQTPTPSPDGLSSRVIIGSAILVVLIAGGILMAWRWQNVRGEQQDK
jgi:hypothetical protein